MEKMQKEELSGVLPVKRGRDSNLRIMLLQLETGEGLKMKASEWHRKTTPYYIVAGIKKTHQRTFEYGLRPDGSEWLFRRLS